MKENGKNNKNGGGYGQPLHQSQKRKEEDMEKSGCQRLLLATMKKKDHVRGKKTEGEEFQGYSLTSSGSLYITSQGKR